jgi:hypothetical protein
MVWFLRLKIISGGKECYNAKQVHVKRQFINYYKTINTSMLKNKRSIKVRHKLEVNIISTWKCKHYMTFCATFGINK